MPASGYLVSPHTMYCEATLVGAHVYTQFLGMHPSQTGISNLAEFTITDTGCYDSCDTGKPVVLDFLYTGDGCDASHHSQDPGSVTCDGDPQDDPSVYIIAGNHSSLSHPNFITWFEGWVDLNDPFHIDARSDGQEFLDSNTFFFVWDEEPTSPQALIIQTVGFHTSCSQPLHVGDQYGSALLVRYTSGGD